MMQPPHARVADTARNRRIDGNELSGERAILDGTGDLVPDHQRGAQLSVADPTLAEPMQIRAADAYGIDSNEHLARRRPRR